jgi:ubiquitin-protein ligase
MRLERDLQDMNNLRNESTILDFEASGGTPAGPEQYQISFSGKTLVAGARGAKISERPQTATISLSGDYPRRQPGIAWGGPILHPNIFGSPGHMTVCLGNFHNQWTPYVRLVDMVEILWDMARLAILNPYSAGPGGGDAVTDWARLRLEFDFPVDRRPLRDKILGPNDGSSIIRQDSPEGEVILLDDDDGVCQK